MAVCLVFAWPLACDDTYVNGCLVMDGWMDGCSSCVFLLDNEFQLASQATHAYLLHWLSAAWPVASIFGL